MKTANIDKFAMHNAVAALLSEAQRVGPIEIKMFDEVESLEAAHKSLGKGQTGENFRRSLDTLPPNRFFWLAAVMEGRVIGTVAARMDESAWTLQKFAKSYWERAYKAKDGEMVELAPDSPVCASQYGNRFAYLGEAIIDESLRNNSLSYILVRLALLFAFDEWKPDVAYGWMRDWHVYRGLASRWGFNRIDANAFDWVTPPEKEDWQNLAFLVCDQQGYRNLLLHPAPPVLFDQKKSSRG